MRKGFYWFGLMMAIAAQLACDGFTKVIDVDYSDHKTKGVIFSLLSNTDVRDTAFRRSSYFSSSESDGHSNRIYISNSVPPSSWVFFYEAYVSLESEEDEFPLTFIDQINEPNIHSSFYAVQGAILPGKTYHIAAAFDPDAASSFVQEWTPVSATDTMPEVVPFSVENAQLEYYDGNIDGTPKGGYFDLKIDDEPGRTNVYLVEVSAIIQLDTTYSRFPTVLYSYIEQSDKTTDLDLFENSRDDLFHEDDFTKDGRKRIRFRFSNNYGSYDREKPVLLLVRLSNLSDNYIRFQRSSQQYSINVDNPFAEPAEIYTNVDNGYGIFALATRTYAEIVIN